MASDSELVVTLSETLLGHMRGRAAALRIPLRWLVAGLVYDTIEASLSGDPGTSRLSWSTSIDGRSGLGDADSALTIASEPACRCRGGADHQA